MSDGFPTIGLTCTTVITTEEPIGPHSASPQTYVDSVTGAGGLPLLLPIVDPEYAAAYLARIDGLILTGGLDVDPFQYGQEPAARLGRIDQKRDAIEVALARGAHAQGIPILAICRGQQLLNVAMGGTLHQHLPDVYEGALRHDQLDLHPDALSHSVQVEPETRLREILGAEHVRVNTFHHQAVDRLAERFRVTARSPDGVVEGIEDPSHPFCIAVQWHPERRLDDPVSRALFRSVVEAARHAADAGVREKARKR
jgi:putative glutamine amidotransferase